MKLIEDLRSTIQDYAPVLATVLGGPMAGIGVSLLSTFFGTKPLDVKELLEKILIDPESATKIKQIELNHIEALEKINATNYATEVDDRKSAREREAAIKDYVPTVLAVSFLLIYACIQFYCITHAIQANDIISARCQDILIMIISYYFGSSHKEINTRQN